MKQNTSKKALFVVVKGSIFPLIMGGAIFYAFLFLRNRYCLDNKECADKTFSVFLIIFVTLWAYKIAVNLFNWYAENIAKKTKSDLDDKFIPLFKRVTVTIIWAIGIIMCLSRLGININALVATLGVSSLAIALAAQDTIANIIAGFLIMIDSPFSVGDKIKLPSGEIVKVVDIGTRRSKFISEDNAIIFMPNVELSKSKIVNYTYGEKEKAGV